MPAWEFLKDGAGILPASNMADPLRSSHLRAVEVLVREAVQNSLDERRKDLQDPVRVRFERRVLKGPDKLRFVGGLGLSQIAERQKYFRSSHAWFAAGRRELEALDDPDTEMPILAISDFNARGLGGRWNRRRSRDDRFFNLVLSIGGSLKWDTDEDDGQPRSLGSYGFGKMAFAMCSRIRTVLYYSTFLPDADTDGDTCRAMASAFLPPHTIDDVDFAGQSFLGNSSDEEGVPAKPVTGQHAHDWISELGVPVRKDEETGTTVVIPATSTTMQDVVDACATWWWPRMGDPELHRRVQFEFIDEGCQLPDCRPRSLPGLSAFIDCYRQAASSDVGDGYEIANIQVRPQGTVRDAGRLVLKAIDRPEPTEPEDDESTNRVALIRDGLVIAYSEGLAHEDKTPIAGVFMPSTDPACERAFVLSEPPSHDAWEENAERLRDRYPWGADFIRLTKGQMKTKTRDFQARNAPPSETEHTTAGAFLRRALGDLFIQRASPPVPPRPRYRAFTIETRESGRRLGPPAEDFVTYAVGLSDHAPVSEQNALVTVSLRALADADGTRGDVVPCEITADGQSQRGEERASLTTTLRKGQSSIFTARGRVHRAWKTKWEIEVTRSPP